MQKESALPWWLKKPFARAKTRSAFKLARTLVTCTLATCSERTIPARTPAIVPAEEVLEMRMRAVPSGALVKRG
jgi:hypothetical protein